MRCRASKSVSSMVRRMSRSVSSLKILSSDIGFHLQRSFHQADIGEVNSREGKVHLRKLPATFFSYDDRGKTQRPHERLPAPQLVYGIGPTTQNMKKFLFGAELRVIDQMFDEVQIGGVII